MDAFVTVVTPKLVSGNATALSFSSYLGGSGADLGYAIALGSNGDIYVAGYTDSSDFAPGYPEQPSPGPNTFVIELGAISLDGASPFNPASRSPYYLAFAGYLGAFDIGNPVAIALRGTDAGDELYVAGYADSTFTFPPITDNSRRFRFGGQTDAFVVKVSNADLSISFETITAFGGTGSEPDHSGRGRFHPSHCGERGSGHSGGSSG